MAFAAREGTFFWANGRAWGLCRVGRKGQGMQVELEVLHGQLVLSEFVLEGEGVCHFDRPKRFAKGRRERFSVRQSGTTGGPS